MPARPTSVAGAFDEFDKAISLNPIERTRAMLRHQKITELLVADRVAADTFLQGSFARKTMRRPLKDVDVVVLLPPALLAEHFTPAGARRVHEFFRPALVGAFGQHISFDVSASAGKALQVCFDDVDFTVDLVAAFADPAGSELIYIADRHEGAWEESNTRTLKRVVAERNQNTGGKFVHQVRMVKEFKAQYPELEDLCGLAAESLTFSVVRVQMSHARAVAATLRYAAGAVLGPVLDPTGVDDLSVKWPDAHRQKYSAVFARGADRAEEALRLEADARFTTAIDIWASLLGEDFPEPVVQSEVEAIKGLVAGSITSTGRTTASRHGAEPTRPTRSWRSH
jgi:Second Messenger Oligonucleotide or Dinucleotide Synthetase domain